MREFIFVIFGVLLFSGCASKALDYEIKSVEYYEPKWYLEFNQELLNELISSAISKNEDIGVAALNLEIAMLNANISKDGYVPTLSGEVGANTGRDISTGDKFKDSYSSKVALSYELDIFGKIYDSYKSKEWLASASRSTLENLRLTIINQVADSYFNILYLNDSLSSLNSNLDNLKELDRVVRAKYELGKEDILAIKQSDESLLNLQNQISLTKRSMQASYEVLKNLTRSDISLDKLSLDGVRVGQNSLDENISSLANRPDINLAIANLNSSFYEYRIDQKDLLPSISLGASLSSSDERFKDSFELNNLAGIISVSLPFLNYYKLKKHIKIGEFEFEKNRLNYEKTLQNAINEVVKFARFYQEDKIRYENLKAILEDATKIVEIYQSRYDQGRVELKDLLEAKNRLISAKISLLNQKYQLLNDELGYYKAIAK